MGESQPEQVAAVALTPEQERNQRLMVLVANFRRAKIAEDQTKRNRIAIEELLAKEIPGEETGQKTISLFNGTKITIKRGLNYRADIKGVQDSLIHYDLPAPIKSKATSELDVIGYEWFKRNHPSAFDEIAKHVTVTPKKVAVVIKEAGA